MDKKGIVIQEYWHFLKSARCVSESSDTLYELFPCQNIHMPLTWVIDGMEFVSISSTWLIQCHVGYERAAKFRKPQVPRVVSVCYHVG